MTHYVLVHGGFVGGRYWSDVAGLLEKEGHQVDVVQQLPSAGPDPALLGGLTEDAQHLRAALDAVPDQVVLVGHSYGGMVITELADHPAVAHSVYLTAAVPPRGRSMMDLMAAGPPITWAAARDDGSIVATDDMELLHRTLCADVDRDRAEPELRRMVPQSVSSFTTPSSAPDRAHPTTYVVCEQDQAIPPAAQEEMAKATDHVVRLPSSHQPMMSMPGALAELLGQVR
jgi:pimeloyl-ACP methyl ester carboxylesterase